MSAASISVGERKELAALVDAAKAARYVAVPRYSLIVRLLTTWPFIETAAM